MTAGKNKAALAAGLVATAMLICAALALAANISCAGGGPVCNGTNQPDTFTGTNNKDEIFAKGGADEVDGLGGNDIEHGGPGVDHLDEDSTNDRDTMFGDGGGDSIEGGPKSDEIFGGEGNEAIYGDEGGDLIAGQDGADVIHSEQGDDIVRGGRGNDTIDAASDESPGGRDKVDCGKGNNDTAIVNPNDDVRRCDGNVTVVP